VTSAITVLKLGGELLQGQDGLRASAAAVAELAATTPLVVVHGGGREIDAELARRGIRPTMVDGLRVTDEDTLESVVAVLAGSINTRFVAALTSAGVRAVGLTGADDGIGLVEPAAPLETRAGTRVDLGLVGHPVGRSAALLAELTDLGCVPVVASIGVDADGRLFNVNADTLAAHLAGVVAAGRLLIAGATSGVLDRAGQTIPQIAVSEIDALGADGTVTAGMLAKLAACRDAVRAGVGEVLIVDGSQPGRLARSAGSRIVPAASPAEVPAAPIATGAEAGEEIKATDLRHVVPVYRRQPIVLERGRGSRVWDAEGREYIDLVSGVGVASLGHAHPRLSRALAEQTGQLMHTSNLYFQAQQAGLARRLAALSGLPRAFFCNSGAEAVEACLKFARRYWYTRGTPRPEIIALEGSFHGRTFGALSVTWDEHYRKPFEPLLQHIVFVKPTDPHALARVVSERTCAIILEPIQGEGGVRALTSEFSAAVNAAAARTGALVIADEVQCGLGRTGVPFYSAALGLKPDLMALGKALGGGVPIGAALSSEAVAASLAPGDHGSTYGGNLLACRAGLVFIEELVDRDLIGHVRDVSAHLDDRLRAIRKENDSVKNLLGVGLLRGLEMDADAGPIVDAARRRGVLVNRTATRVVRMLPPLTIAKDDLDLGIDRLAEAIQETTAEVRA
jgi:acetylglutamate kinase